MNTFLPEGYKAPEGNYMKFKQGKNSFRILGSAITGWEYWTEENKPVRSRTEFLGVPKDIKEDADGSVSIKHFWMFPVWNYLAEKVQVLEVTQKSIQDAIKASYENPKWGDPTKYDFLITRKDGAKVSYQVQPEPHSEMAPEVTAKVNAVFINLNAIFSGDDPFTAKETNTLSSLAALPDEAPASEPVQQQPAGLTAEQKNEIKLADVPF